MLKRAATRKRENSKKVKTKAPAAPKFFYRTKEYFAYTHKLIEIVQNTFPEGIKLKPQEKKERVDFRKLLLEQELDTIQKSSLSISEKEDLSTKYKTWIKNYNNLLKKM